MSTLPDSAYEMLPSLRDFFRGGLLSRFFCQTGWHRWQVWKNVDCRTWKVEWSRQCLECASKENLVERPEA